MAYVDELVSQMQSTIASPRNPDTYLQMPDGSSLYNSWGGGASMAKISSYQTIVGALAGHNQYMVDNFAATVQFLTFNVLNGHTATNTCVDARNGFCCVLKSSNQWEFAYQGAAFWGTRLYNGNVYGPRTDGTQTRLSSGITRFQPGPAIILPNETASQKAQAGYEVWPEARAETPGVESFWGAINKTLFQSAKCFVHGVQLKLSLWDQNRPDDRNSAFIVAQTGFDAWSYPPTGWRHITDDGVTSDDLHTGYPYGAFEGSNGPWKRLVGNDWQWLFSCTVADIAVNPTALPPPWGDYSQPWPWNSIPTYSISEATLRSNPPPPPDAWYGGAEPPSPVEGRLPLVSVSAWEPRTSSGTNNWVSRTPSLSAPTKSRRSRRIRVFGD